MLFLNFGQLNNDYDGDSRPTLQGPKTTQVSGEQDEENDQNTARLFALYMKSKHWNKAIMDLSNLIKNQWKGREEFIKAQGSVAVVLMIAYIGNTWEPNYPRDNNESYPMFWTMNGLLLIAALCTLKHDPNASSRGVQLLSRPQTEEWKGWMQWAFIMVCYVPRCCVLDKSASQTLTCLPSFLCCIFHQYHYYRARHVYNFIRVFVSAYVWMTGFGNFLYFDKKQDFSVTRAVSMWLRINYFPILLSVILGVEFDLFYIVPLHTTAFFITMFTCLFAKMLGTWYNYPSEKRNLIAIATCFAVHVVFYETPIVNSLNAIFGYEIFFRFSSDKYSAVVGILSGYCWGYFKKYMQWCHIPANEDGSYSREQTNAMWIQRLLGPTLIFIWYFFVGYIPDKTVYNPYHPYVFILPIAGWLLLRNSSKYLTEVHSTALEFFGKITLETYVLQFHVFMNVNVQHIPVVIPGATADGPWILKTLNMLLTGVGFVALAYWARKITVTTQTTVTELVVLLQQGDSSGDAADVEKEPLKDGAKESSTDAVVDPEKASGST